MFYLFEWVALWLALSFLHLRFCSTDHEVKSSLIGTLWPLLFTRRPPNFLLLYSVIQHHMLLIQAPLAALGCINFSSEVKSTEMAI